jgi:hypothetical protein
MDMTKLTYKGRQAEVFKIDDEWIAKYRDEKKKHTMVVSADSYLELAKEYAEAVDDTFGPKH